MINSKLFDENVTDACGETALHHAIKHSHKEIVLILSKNGQLADESGIGLNAQDYSKLVLLYVF
jgi:hypothetical protein